MLAKVDDVAKEFSAATDLSDMNEVVYTTVQSSLKDMLPKLAKVKEWDLHDICNGQASAMSTILLMARALRGWSFGRTAKSTSAKATLLKVFSEMQEKFPTIIVPYPVRLVVLCTANMHERGQKQDWEGLGALIPHGTLSQGLQGSMLGVGCWDVFEVIVKYELLTMKYEY